MLWRFGEMKDHIWSGYDSSKGNSLLRKPKKHGGIQKAEAVGFKASVAHSGALALYYGWLWQ